MEKIINRITLNVSGKNAFHAMIAKQFDNATRVVEAIITDNGTPIEISPTDAVFVNFRRPKFSTDKEPTDYKRAVRCELVDGARGIIRLPVDYWAIERSGDVSADVSVLTEGVPERVTTAAFTITVFPASYYEEGNLHGESYDALLDLFQHVGEYKREITDTMQGAVDHTLANENQRMTEFTELKAAMQAVFNEAEASAAAAAQSERNAAASERVVLATVGDATTLLNETQVLIANAEISANTAAQHANSAALSAGTATSARDEINATVGEFRAWYDRLPEKGIDIHDDFIDFNKLVTFKTTVNIDTAPTAPSHAVNKAYLESFMPDRAMNAFRLNDTYGSIILYDEAFGIKVQSFAGGVWNEGIYVVETSKEGNPYATITCGSEDKRNLLSMCCCSSDGGRYFNVVRDGQTYSIHFPSKSGTFALTSDLEVYLTSYGIVNADTYVDFHKIATFKTTVNLDAAPTESQHAVNKGHLDSRLSALSQAIDQTYVRKDEVSSLPVGGGTHFNYSDLSGFISSVYVGTESDAAYPQSINGSDASGGYYDPEVYINRGSQKLYSFNGVECIDFYKYYDYAYISAERKYAVLQFYGSFDIRISSRLNSKYSASITTETYYCVNPVLVSRVRYGSYYFDIYYTDENGNQQKILYSEYTSMLLGGVEIKRHRETDDDYSYAVMVRYKRLGGSIY